MAKDGLAILIGAPKGKGFSKGKPPLDEEEDDIDPMEDEGDEPDDLLLAAEDILSAVRAKDADMLADALRAAYQACSSEGEKPSEDDSEDEYE